MGSLFFGWCIKNNKYFWQISPISNTTKQLDYLALRKAYFLYADYKKGILDSIILDQILSLKNSMNKKRNNFIQSPLTIWPFDHLTIWPFDHLTIWPLDHLTIWPLDHLTTYNIKISPYWLLGLIEGEGYFLVT